MRRSVIILAGLMHCLGSAGTAYAQDNAASCAAKSYLGNDYTICRFNPSDSDIRLFHKSEAGEVYGSFEAVNAALSNTGEQLSFAMNAGMYHKDRSPVGLYIEAGRQKQKINTNKGPGNFHMLPNGVFWLTQFEDSDAAYKGAGVASAEAFLARGDDSPSVIDATQSGPMLVIDGVIHPQFKSNSTSYRIRNGVGQVGDELVFVKSEVPVTFHAFASLYKNKLGAKNALYLDGTISSLYAPNLGRNDRGIKMGPIVGVVVAEGRKTN